jgi:hypothetical protein
VFICRANAPVEATLPESPGKECIVGEQVL